MRASSPARYLDGADPKHAGKPGEARVRALQQRDGQDVGRGTGHAVGIVRGDVELDAGGLQPLDPGAGVICVLPAQLDEHADAACMICQAAEAGDRGFGGSPSQSFGLKRACFSGSQAKAGSMTCLPARPGLAGKQTPMAASSGRCCASMRWKAVEPVQAIPTCSRISGLGWPGAGLRGPS
jgi:hypothetical protein